MSNDDPRSRYGLSCPVGGTFYICKDTPTQFFGCCDVDPCQNDGNCPSASLHAASFSKNSYSDLPTEDCAGAGDWYTCKFNSPPFVGCCLENPCQNKRCSPGNVTAAKLSSNEANAAPFLVGSSSPSPSDSASSSSKSGSKSLSTGAIVGIAVGGAVALALIGFLLWRLQRQRKKKVLYHPPQDPTSLSAHGSPLGGPPPPVSMHNHHKDSFYNNGGMTPTTMVNSISTRSTPLPAESFYDVHSARTSYQPPVSPQHGPGGPNPWAPSPHHNQRLSTHSSMLSDYGGSGIQYQPTSAPISELAGSDMGKGGPGGGSVSEIGWSARQQRP